jgi:hypothetical protein
MDARGILGSKKLMSGLAAQVRRNDTITTVASP